MTTPLQAAHPSTGNFHTNKRKAAVWPRIGLAMVLMAAAAGICGCQIPHAAKKLIPSSSWFHSQPNPTPAATPATPGSASYASSPLMEGDLVTISFEYSTNLNRVQKIAVDGTMNLQSAAPVKAAGKTPRELEDELHKIYQSQIKDEAVTVSLISAVSSVYVSGAVLRSGKLPMDRPMTVLEAIMEAGGFDPNRAKLSEVTVLRTENGTQTRYKINLQRVLDGKEPKAFYLKPFDIVHVPSKTFNF